MKRPKPNYGLMFKSAVSVLQHDFGKYMKLLNGQNSCLFITNDGYLGIMDNDFDKKIEELRGQLLIDFAKVAELRAVIQNDKRRSV